MVNTRCGTKTSLLWNQYLGCPGRICMSVRLNKILLLKAIKKSHRKSVSVKLGKRHDVCSVLQLGRNGKPQQMQHIVGDRKSLERDVKPLQRPDRKPLQRPIFVKRPGVLKGPDGKLNRLIAV